MVRMIYPGLRAETVGARHAAPAPPLSAADLGILRKLGKRPESAIEELRILRAGSKPHALVRPCTAGDGVERLSRQDLHTAATRFTADASRRRICKFIVAAGSASRMFQMFDSGEERPRRLLCERLHELALFPALAAAMSRRGLDARRLAQAGDWRPIADALLGDDGLGLAKLPKGLIPFHGYPDGARTALEEHVAEALGYAAGSGNLVHLHAVVSSGHERTAGAHLAAAARRFEHANVRIKTETSIQSDASRTIALDAGGAVVRDQDGRPALRPAGHGAALDNLNALRGDIVFVRTVDNVLPSAFFDFVSFHKKALGGVLFEIEAALHGCLAEISSAGAGEQAVRRAAELLEQRLSTPLPCDWPDRTREVRRRFLFDRLNRPLRVCAVVPNGGKPGGAPFWIRTPEGDRLRIVDRPEVDLTDNRQRDIWEAAPYFNPADLVCSVRDFRGNAFDLSRYRASGEWYILERLHEGEVIRVLERSGLWNGAMAGWNTVFVEAPPETLRPVKTILELLDLPALPRG